VAHGVPDELINTRVQACGERIYGAAGDRSQPRYRCYTPQPKAELDSCPECEEGNNV